MNNNRSHVRILLLFTLVFALCTTTLFTTNAEARRADEVFDSATVSLKKQKRLYTTQQHMVLKKLYQLQIAGWRKRLVPSG